MDFQRHFYCVFFYTNISFCKSSHQNLAGNPVKLFHKMARETVKRDAESVWKERERENKSLLFNFTRKFTDFDTFTKTA